MKIIFANRSDSLTSKGGDTTQMLLTKKYLESLYHLDIEICLTLGELESKSFDILHVFNLQTYRESAEFIKVALKKNCKVVLSPIYWNYKYSMFSYGLGLFNIYKPVKIYQKLSEIVLCFSGMFASSSYLSAANRKCVSFIIDHSDIILPASDEEMDLIFKHFGLPKGKKTLVVPNAVELNENEVFESPVPKSDIIIQVATLIPSKNQSGTLLALKKLPDFELYFIGRIKDLKYYRYLLKLAKKRGRVFFTGELSQQDVTDFYKKARVHVLPSLGESTGLVTLEAFFHHCEIVVSKDPYSPVRYYKFNEIAHICDPYQVASINMAILDAIKNPKLGTIDRRDYFDLFNYKTVARNTFEAYRSVLNDNSN